MGDPVQKICNISVHLPRDYLSIYKKRLAELNRN